MVKPEKRLALVTKFAERVPRKAIDRNLVGHLLRNHRGIYALYDSEGELSYIGLASEDIYDRLKDHLTDQLANSWDFFSVYCLTDHAAPYLRDLESVLQRTRVPGENRQVTSFAKAKDVTPDVIDSIPGGPFWLAIQNREITPGTPLRMKRGGKWVKAEVEARGGIKFAGHTYESFSSAARAVAGYTKRNQQLNGWDYWEYEKSPETWRPVTDFK